MNIPIYMGKVSSAEIERANNGFKHLKQDLEKMEMLG